MMTPKSNPSESKTVSNKQVDNPCEPSFFALWSLRQLQVECARLNQVLQEVIDITERVKNATR
ncbi:MAG TPA: hypothetical protein VII94_00255 [Candidatus Saccharimonadales bacterium]